MADRASKLRRLDAFRRSIPNVSASALAEILNKCVDDMPEIRDRNALRQARDLQITADTPYGPLLQTLQVERDDGSIHDLQIISPFAHLYVAAKTCKSFADMLKARLNVKVCTPASPWGFILYSDEVVPGNTMAILNARKLWALYWSLLEYGPSILSDEEAWSCVVAEPTDNVKLLNSGIGQVFTVLLKFLFASATHRLQDGALLLDLFGGGQVRLFINLRMIVQDGGAHKQVFCLKGDSGMKFCLECRTLFSVRSSVVDENGQSIFTCNLYRHSEMDMATDADVRGTVRRLADIAATRPRELYLRQQACGFVHMKYNMILARELDGVLEPVSHKAHDWMHAMMVSGVFNVILFLTLYCLSVVDSDITDKLQQYVRLWSFPRRIGQNPQRLSDLFSKNRWESNKKAKTFKCSASEGLTLYPIIWCYIHAVFVRNRTLTSVCEAYMMLCNIIDLLVSIPHGQVTPPMLHEAVDVFLKACVDAGWKEYFIPKFHWLIHLASDLQRFGTLCSCWVQERKHRLVKRFANYNRSQKKYTSGMLAEITCHHFACLSSADHFDLRPHLVAPTKVCKPNVISRLSASCPGIPLMGNVITSQRARVSEFEICRVRDVVVFKNQPGELTIGEIWFFFASGETLGCVISSWRVLSTDEVQGTCTARITDDNVGVRMIIDILAATTYRRKSDGTAQVIVPCMYRDHVKPSR